MADTSLLRGGGLVAIGLMDGRVHNRRLVKFSPHLTILAVEQDSDPERNRRAMDRDEILWVERVAYVAFLRNPAERIHRPAVPGGTRLRIHVPGGKWFLVDVAPSPGAPPGGFYALPADDGSPFKEIYFYEHGINAREAAEPLGAFLVKEGAVAARQIDQGLDARNQKLGQILLSQEKLVPEMIHAAVELQERKRLRLGQILVEEGLIAQKDVDLALAEQRTRRGKKIGELLVEMNILKEEDLVNALATKFHLSRINLDEHPPRPEAAREVPRELIERYGFLPLDTSDRDFSIAIADPLFTEIHDVLRFHLKRKRIIEFLAPPSQLKRHVEAFLLASAVQTAPEPEPVDMESLLKEAGEESAVELEAEEEVNASDSIVKKLANQIIIDAYRRGASDIHIEPNGKEKNLAIRFRIDGDCVAYQELPAAFRAPLVARLKIMSQLDISERRKPQDGKIRFSMKDRRIELRVATLPTVNGNEDVVLRILASSKPLPLDKIGIRERNLAELRRVLAQPYGLILCVGPTGSGKTTTLHSMLGSINTVDMKIWTAEDPVEITQAGLRQVQVQPKIGLTFAAAMRAFLRADPDVIMVGEMRDHETAATAIEASLTGHLVLSTLHTNSAPETITRLLDMGLDPFSFADALLGVLAQRLARALCKACRVSYVPEPDEFQELATLYGGAEALHKTLGVRSGPDFKLWRAPGCPACGGTGYKGRLGLHELLVSSLEIKRAVQHKSPVEELRRTAMEQGMTTLLQDGIAKAILGLTDLRQVLAVCSR